MAASKTADRFREMWRKNWPEAHAALTGGLPDFVLSPSPASVTAQVPVFCYHVVSAEGFEEDLRYLQENGYQTLDADSYLERLRDPDPPRARAVVLTFDDGARNLFETVFPLLNAYGMKAVAFICPGLHREEAEYAVTTDGREDGRPCSWEQIEAMHASGVIDFQSHTLEHRYVPRWPEAAPLAGSRADVVDKLRGRPLPLGEDLRTSKTTLENRLGKRVVHLAFPKFIGTRRAVEEGTAAGYEAFWWGALPGSRTRPGKLRPSHLPRLNDEWLGRLPGDGRKRLSEVVSQRASGSWKRLLNRKNTKEPSTVRSGQGGEE
ncbi:MAG: polysaccharide deacetylase family protein [Gemmatimonadetes bacterium]|nr:polysaccharide deacetylase family protein [Gemmatimonadota bacterium]